MVELPFEYEYQGGIHEEAIDLVVKFHEGKQLGAGVYIAEDPAMRDQVCEFPTYEQAETCKDELESLGIPGIGFGSIETTKEWANEELAKMTLEKGD